MCRKTAKKSLKATIYHLNQRLENGDAVHDNLHEAKDDLELRLLHEMKGAQVQAHMQWVEEGEHSASYLFQQEKCSAAKIGDSVHFSVGYVFCNNICSHFRCF